MFTAGEGVESRMECRASYNMAIPFWFSILKEIYLHIKIVLPASYNAYSAKIFKKVLFHLFVYSKKCLYLCPWKVHKA